MTRYVAFLRGVSPVNARMPDLVRSFEAAGHAHVRTVLSSGNVLFEARTASEATLERKAGAAMEQVLGRRFHPIVRSAAFLAELLESDPFAAWSVPAGAKRVVTFSRKALQPAVALPFEQDGARLLAVDDRQAYTAYVPGPSGPVFMTLIERAFGKEVTTRTWDTVARCVRG